jgi:hypothetical protein
MFLNYDYDEKEIYNVFIVIYDYLLMLYNYYY